MILTIGNELFFAIFFSNRIQYDINQDKTQLLEIVEC